MKKLILVLMLGLSLLLVKPCDAFELGKWSSNNMLEAYAKDTYDMYRFDFTSMNRIKGWKGYVVFKSWAEYDEDFSSLTATTQFKTTIAQPVWKNLYVMGQYMYTDTPRSYKETVRLGVGLKF